jgi:hypothetical protein
LDRRAASRESRASGGRYTSVAAALGAEEVHPPEILQYARPPENLTSPVRESNGYLSPESLTLSPEPGTDAAIQKLFFDSIVNGNVNRRVSRSSVNADCESGEVVSSPEGESRPTSRRASSGGRRSASTSDRGRPQPGLVRKTSRTSNGSTGRNVADSENNEAVGKLGRKSVLAVLRQSFRRSKKERPAVAVRKTSQAPANASRPSLFTSPSSTSVVVKTSVTPPDIHGSRESSRRFDYSSISVASVRTGRTLTPSRASIVSKGSGVSGVSAAPEERCGSFSLRVQAGLRQAAGSGESLEAPGSEAGEDMTTSVKSVNPDYSMVGRSRTSPMITSPGVGRPRCLPETPKLLPTAAVPPIYANVQQQMASGNSRQLSGIAKILEENGNKRTLENGVQKSASVSAGPPAIPKPAARLSIRQKVNWDRIAAPDDSLPLRICLHFNF